MAIAVFRNEGGAALDIETTGLSSDLHYTTVIGGLLIKGHSINGYGRNRSTNFETFFNRLRC